MPKHLAGKETDFDLKIMASIMRCSVEVDLKEFCIKGMSMTQEDGIKAMALRPKKHSMRIDAKKRWRPGMKIHAFYWTGKPYHSDHWKFAPLFNCSSIQTVNIQRYDAKDYFSPMEISIDGKAISWKKMKELALNDGFNNLQDFMSYFKDSCELTLIHWTDLRY
jgi:hypothetical protein